MAISRASSSTLSNGFPKPQKFWDQKTVGSVATPYLVAKFESPPSSGSTWTDTAGGYQLSLSNTTYSSNNGGYLTFNGSSSYGTAASFPTVPYLSSGVTFAMWVYPTSLSGTSYTTALPIMGIGNSSAGNGSYLVTLGSSNFIGNGYNQTGWETAHGMSINNWYLVVWTHNPTSPMPGKVYVNNVLKTTSGALIGADKAAPFDIGRAQTLNTNYFAGRIASVYYWNTELKPSDILQLWTYSKGRFGL